MDSTTDYVEVTPVLRSCVGCHLMRRDTGTCHYATWCASLVRDPEGTLWVYARPLNGDGPIRAAREHLSIPPRMLR